MSITSYLTDRTKVSSSKGDFDMIDVKLNFKGHLDYACADAVSTGKTLKADGAKNALAEIQSQVTRGQSSSL